MARLTAQLLAGDVALSDGELWAGLPAATARMLAEPLLSDRPRDITALLRQLRSALSPSTRRPTASVTAAVGLRVQLRVTSAAPDQIELLRDALAVARVACVDYDFDIAAEQPNAILALRCLDDGEDAEASRRAAARIAERINDELSPLRGEGLTAQVSVRNGRVIARKNGERVRYLGGDLMNASGWSGADKWRSPATTRVTTATRSSPDRKKRAEAATEGVEGHLRRSRRAASRDDERWAIERKQGACRNSDQTFPESTERGGGHAARRPAREENEHTLFGSDLPVGAQVGNYIVESKLARGGFATIYAARHAALGRKTALKLLHQGLAGSPEMVRRFEQEAQAVNYIRHPNIVDIFEFGAPTTGGPSSRWSGWRATTSTGIWRRAGRCRRPRRWR